MSDSPTAKSNAGVFADTPAPASIHDLITLAMNHHNRGDFPAAEACWRQLLLVIPAWPDLYNNLGCALQAQGKIPAAIECFTRVLELDPNSAMAHYNLGHLHHRDGETTAAEQHYLQALCLDPNHVSALANLGSMLLDRGDLAGAEARYLQALSLKPEHAESRNNLGNVHKRRGQLDQAVACYQQAIALRADYADAHNNLGCALLDLRRPDAAVRSFQRAIALRPDYAEAICNMGVALKDQGKPDAALECFAQAVQLKPDYTEAYNLWGAAVKMNGDLDTAMTLFDRALASNPAFAPALCNRANILLDQGSIEMALEAFRAALASEPDFPEAHFGLSKLLDFRAAPVELEQLQQLERRIELLPPNKRPYIHFALAKAMDDRGDFPAAFEQLQKGSAIKRSLIEYDEESTLQQWRQIARVFDRARIEQHRGHGDVSQTPVFVLGMPRSGSTLIEHILSSHPQIMGAGELSTLSDAVNRAGLYPQAFETMAPDDWCRLGRAYLRELPALPPGKLRITDKMPGNFIYVGLIHLILPKARIIHTQRDPADTCLSCYSSLFTNGMSYSYNLGELGRYYRAYMQLMDHWRSVLPSGVMLDLQYESLVDDLPGQARRLVEHCGLPWDERCLKFTENQRPVSTASNLHIRRPIYKSSVHRWRRYEPFLRPLLDELE